MCHVMKMFAITGISDDLCSNSNTEIVQKPSVTHSVSTKDPNKIPEDVYPESGFRLPFPKRDDFDDYGKKVYDKLVGPGKRTLAGLCGPYGIRLYSPKIAEMANALSLYFRYESGLNGRIRELAIIVTAREMDSTFEWTVHEPEAIKVGLSQEIIDIVKYRKSVAGLPEIEAVIIQFGRQMFGQKNVNSETFARALKIFSPKELVEIISLMAHYSSTAMLLSAFDIQWGPSQEKLEPLP